MRKLRSNRFEDFFADDAYLLLKNHLYNYLLRRRAVRKCLNSKIGESILEVGSGMSPMTEMSERIVYAELSFAALLALKRGKGFGYFVAADATHLPFKNGSFSEIICSEVLEHLQKDQPALHEMASVLKPGGSLILTFPHRHFFFTGDDRFVSHYRRYEIIEMKTNLCKAGFNTVEIRKVLGPLDKLTMLLGITMIKLFNRFKKEKNNNRNGTRQPIHTLIATVFAWLNILYCIPVWIDARLAPRCLSSVVLICAVKRRE